MINKFNNKKTLYCIFVLGILVIAAFLRAVGLSVTHAYKAYIWFINIITVVVPARTKKIFTVGFREPFYWRVSELVSFLTVLGCVGWFVKNLLIKRDKNVG